MLRRDGPDGGVAVGFVDDHPVVLQGVVHHLRAALPEITATHTASDVAGLVAGLGASGRIDLVVLDIQLGDRSVPEHNVATLRRSGARVLLYSQETRASVVARCLQAGAFGIVSKSEPLDVVTEAVRCVLRGEPHLNADWAAAIRADTQRQQPTFAPREEEALRLYALGLPVTSVATRMYVAPATVKEYLLRVRRKYADAGRDATSKTDLLFRAIEDGLIDPPRPR